MHNRNQCTSTNINENTLKPLKLDRCYERCWSRNRAQLHVTKRACFVATARFASTVRVGSLSTLKHVGLFVAPDTCPPLAQVIDHFMDFCVVCALHEKGLQRGLGGNVFFFGLSVWLAHASASITFVVGVCGSSLHACRQGRRAMDRLSCEFFVFVMEFGPTWARNGFSFRSDNPLQAICEGFGAEMGPQQIFAQKRKSVADYLWWNSATILTQLVTSVEKVFFFVENSVFYKGDFHNLAFRSRVRSI